MTIAGVWGHKTWSIAMPVARFAHTTLLCWLAAFAAACEEHLPTGAMLDAGEGAAAAPLESSPPGVVSPDKRANASSSAVTYDPFRGVVWTANGDVGSVSRVDVDSRTLVQEVAIGKDIRSVALSPDGAWIAAVDRAGATVALVDAETGQVRATVAVGPHPRACVWDAANPRWLYASSEDTGVVAVVDRTLGSVAQTIDVGRLPSGLAVSRDRRELYVTHRMDGDVTIVDLHTRTVAADVQLADEPFSDPGTPNGKPLGLESLAITADGTRGWVPHELLAPAHPFVFNQTLFPAISVVDLVGQAEVQTDPTDAFMKIAGRKNLFDAIKFVDPDAQPTVLSQPCAVAMHPNGAVAWAVACASEDLITFSVTSGTATDLLRNLPCNHPVGLAMDLTGQRVFVACDQSHALLTLDTAGGNPVQHTTLYGDPISLVRSDPIDPDLRAGLRFFFRANSSKAPPATTRNNWMSCGGCHLDGFGSTNMRLFESLRVHDPQVDAQIGHGAKYALRDHFSSAPQVGETDPHDILVAFSDQGAPTDPDNPTQDEAQAALQIGQVIAQDLSNGPTWLHSDGKPSPDSDAAFCGNCHKPEYEAWQQSVHAHSAEDPLFVYGVGVERDLVGQPFTRLCYGCHDPVSTRIGDSAPRQVTCLGCHDVEQAIRAGGNGDLVAAAYDWNTDHKDRALASLEDLRKPEFCGGCHQQFVPGTGLVTIGTLGEYHSSAYPTADPAIRCVDCHMPKSNGVADHHFPGGNIYLASHYQQDVLVGEQKQNLARAVSLEARRVPGGVLVTVHNTGVGHSFPTGVTDLREAWVELDAQDGSLHIGGPSQDGQLSPGAARLGTDLAAADGGILYHHELSLATHVAFDVRVPAGEAQALFIPLSSDQTATLSPNGSSGLDAVLYYRNIRTTYVRAALGDPSAVAPATELARAAVQ
jgi:DNA-binding beta-propeller fold protein YncE